MKSNREIATQIIEAFDSLSRNIRVRVISFTGIQILLNLLDLAGIFLMGTLGALTVTGLESREPSNTSLRITNWLGISNYSFQRQVALLSILSVSFLLIRTLSSAFLSFKLFKLLSVSSAELSNLLYGKFLNQKLENVQKRSIQQNIFSLSVGVDIFIVKILGNLSSLFADTSLLLMVFIGLIFFDFSLALCSLLIFIVAAMLINKLLVKKSKSLGKINTELNVGINMNISEFIAAYREIRVRNLNYFFFERFTNLRKQLAQNSAELNYMPYISKYVLEVVLILGGLSVCLFQFILHDAVHAVAMLSIFLVASSRVAPAALRVQQGILQIRSALGQSISTTELLGELKFVDSLDQIKIKPSINRLDFRPDIRIEKFSYSYPNANKPALSNLSLEIQSGKFVAFVGPSGSGKTTLVDAILGIIDTKAAHISVSGVRPELAISKWPGAIAYVPQFVQIFEGNIRENVTLDFSNLNSNNDQLYEVLRISQLLEFVNSLENGVETFVGQSGVKLSGGERQRLGIARALFTKPKLLILDEATSSLDGQLESIIIENIRLSLNGCTLVVVAHRLSSIVDADCLYYVDRGEIRSIGRFHEVRKTVPDFDLQAKLMGL